MELEKLETKEEELTDIQNRDLFRSIVMGEDVTETIDTSRGEFKIKFPRARDLEAISRVCASRLMGIPVQCFDNITYNMMQMIAYLDVVVLSGPDWYELAKKKSNFSFRDIPDVEFIEEVYAKAYSFRQKVTEKIKSNKGPGNNKVDADRSSNNPDEPGLFDEFSGEQRIDG